LKASDAIAKFLIAKNIHNCFELVGGMITHLIDSFAQSGKFNIISMHHEQAAAFAAEGVARKTKGAKIAVAMGTSGPGATNLITGIGSCWFDSVPCVFITGQVNRSELKGNSFIRQQGFQELDIVEVIKPLTKYAIRIDCIDDLLPILHKGLSYALSGRQGPVLIDIPNDIQKDLIQDEIVHKWINTPLDIIDSKEIHYSDLKSLKSFCGESKRPLFCIGGGARWSLNMPNWLSMANKICLPYVSTLMGHERVVVGDAYFNMIGSYGNREANWAIQHCDLLIVIGARLDVRQTGSNIDDFARNAKIIQIDIDSNQLNNRVKADMSINASSDSFFKKFELTKDVFPNLDETWHKNLVSKRELGLLNEYPTWDLSPSEIFKKFNEKLIHKEIDYVCDVGNHQMWAAQNIRISKKQAIHYSGGMGAMGFALPTAIGIAIESKNKVIVITGDGSLQINIQELDTLKRLNLDIAIIVMNNSSLGMVKNFQDVYFDGRDQSTKKGYSKPNFTKIAKAYEINSLQVNNYNQLDDALKLIDNSNTPLLIEIIMPYASDCRPRLKFGSRLDDQSPKIKEW
jgi:acetolactate synthase-1/2/3 large subunit